MERIETSESESESRLSTWESRGEFKRGPKEHKVSPGSSALFANDARGEAIEHAAVDHVSPRGIETLIRRKWSVFNRDNAGRSELAFAETVSQSLGPLELNKLAPITPVDRD